MSNPDVGTLAIPGTVEYELARLRQVVDHDLFKLRQTVIHQANEIKTLGVLFRDLTRRLDEREKA